MNKRNNMRTKFFFCNQSSFNDTKSILFFNSSKWLNTKTLKSISMKQSKFNKKTSCLKKKKLVFITVGVIVGAIVLFSFAFLLSKILANTSDANDTTSTIVVPMIDDENDNTTPTTTIAPVINVDDEKDNASSTTINNDVVSPTHSPLCTDDGKLDEDDYPNPIPKCWKIYNWCTKFNSKNKNKTQCFFFALHSW